MQTLNCRLGLVVLCVIFLLPFEVGAKEPVFYPAKRYPNFPFAEAVAYKGVLYLSGDVGAGADGSLVEGGIGPESRQTMENIKATLLRHQLDMSDIIKCTVFLADMAEWQTFNEVYASYFEKGRYPARSALGASSLALGARVELECMAALAEDV